MREDWTSFHKLPKPLRTAKNVRGRLRKKWTEGVLRGGHAESTVILFNRSLSGSDFPASRGLFFPLVFGGREEKRKRVYFPLVRRLPSSETQGQSVGSGEKAGRKFSSKGERAPGYRLSPDHYQKFKRMLAPDWAQKMHCIIVPNRWTHLLSSFRVFVHDRCCLEHGLSGSCTKEMQALRKLSVWYKIPIWFQNTVCPKTTDAFPKIQASAYNRYSGLHGSRLA